MPLLLVVPVRNAEHKALLWSKRWNSGDVKGLKLVLSLCDWEGDITNPVLRHAFTDKIARTLVSLLTTRQQDKYLRNYLREINKPQLRVRFAQTIYNKELHPATRNYPNHLEFLAAYQAAFYLLETRRNTSPFESRPILNNQTFFDRCALELTHINRSESNKRRRVKRASAKQQQPQQPLQENIIIRGASQLSEGATASTRPSSSTASTSSQSSSPPSTPSTRPSSSTSSNSGVIRAPSQATSSTANSKILDVEEENRLYSNIEISPPSS